MCARAAALMGVAARGCVAVLTSRAHLHPLSCAFRFGTRVPIFGSPPPSRPRHPPPLHRPRRLPPHRSPHEARGASRARTRRASRSRRASARTMAAKSAMTRQPTIATSAVMGARGLVCARHATPLPCLAAWVLLTLRACVCVMSIHRVCVCVSVCVCVCVCVCVTDLPSKGVHYCVGKKEAPDPLRDDLIQFLNEGGGH